MSARGLLATLLALLAAGCAQHRPAPSNDDLVVAQLSEPISLNPFYLQGSDSTEVGSLVYSFLTRFDSDNRIVPDVAIAVPSRRNGGISRDGKIIVYRLRPNAKWQDGYPLTAQDVVFSYHASVNPANTLPAQSPYDPVANVSACGQYAVCVRLKRPYAPILSMFFGVDGNPILPQHLLSRYRTLDGAAFNLAPIGSGPYRVQRWARGDRLDLVANGAYFGGKPKIGHISIRFIPSHATILNELRSNEVDAAFFVSPAEINALQSLQNYRVVVTRDRPSFGLIAFNLTDPIVRSSAIRRALAYALDRAELTKKATSGLYDASTGLRGLFGWGYDPTAVRIAQNTVRAKSILVNAGWKAGGDGIRVKDGSRLRLLLVFYGQSFAANAIVPLIAEQARAAGIEIEAKPYDVNQLYARNGPLYRHAFQLALLGLQTGLDPDPTSYLACDQHTPNGFNFAGYCNPSIDRVLQQALETYDRGQRRRLYRLVQQALVKDVPYLFLWQTSEVDAIPRLLAGYEANAGGGPFASVAQWHFLP